MDSTLQIIGDDSIMVEALKSFTTPAEIEALEGELLGIDDITPPVSHWFCDGMYFRKVVIPKGVLAIGHEHTRDCMNIVISGAVSVVINGKTQLVTAGMCFVSPANQRKVGFIHEELTWITAHKISAKDVEAAENETIIKSKTFQRYEEEKGAISIPVSNTHDEYWEDRLDFFNAVKELGFTLDQVKAIAENTNDLIDFPGATGDNVYIATSPISGNGVFAAFSVIPDSSIGFGRFAGKRTKIGRFTNHAKRPNCEFRVDHNGDVELYSLTFINKGEELTVDYRQALSAAIQADSMTLNTQ